MVHTVYLNRMDKTLFSSTFLHALDYIQSLMQIYFDHTMHHCWNKMNCEQHNSKTFIQMFRNLSFTIPSWDDANTIPGGTPFSCFKWINMDISLHKENGTLLLKQPTSFLTLKNTQWIPLFLKEGGMIQLAVGRFLSFEKVQHFNYFSYLDRSVLIGSP